MALRGGLTAAAGGEVARSVGLAVPLLRAARDGLLDLLLPVACVACRRLLDAGEPGVVCGRCWARLQLLPAPHCERCGHPTRGQSCRWCEQLPPYVRAVRSVCWAHGGAGRDVVHALKYGGWPRAAEGMAERMARLAWPVDVVAERAALVPVPLGAARRRARGYNQSERLARALAARWLLPVWADLLVRGRETSSQTRLTPDQRRRNVSGAFRVAHDAGGRLDGAHVVLVDDVITTAATLNACAAALFAAGARIVSYVTFGRAPTPADRI